MGLANQCLLVQWKKSLRKISAFHVHVRVHSFKRYSLCAHSLPDSKVIATNSFLNCIVSWSYNSLPVYAWHPYKAPEFPRQRGLALRTSGPQPFWFKGSVLSKTIFPWTGEGVGRGRFQDDSRALHLCLLHYIYVYYYYTSSTSVNRH